MNTIISCKLQILFSKASLRLDRFCSWIFQDRVPTYPSLSCNSVLQTKPALNSEMAFVSLGLDYVTNIWLLRLSIQWPKLVFGWLPVLSFFFSLGLFQDRICFSNSPGCSELTLYTRMASLLSACVSLPCGVKRHVPPYFVQVISDYAILFLLF